MDAILNIKPPRMHSLFMDYLLILCQSSVFGIALFEKTVPPLHIDLEQNLITAVWTSSAMKCAFQCDRDPNCKSFLYSKKACYSEPSHDLYTGEFSSTFTHKTCQSWSSHPHNFADGDFPDGSMIRAKNYCRDPGGEKGFLWCYTTEGSPEWEPCDIPPCDQDYSDGQCIATSNLTSYMGTTDVTISGITCQRWGSIHPHIHIYLLSKFFPDVSVSAAENHCRDVNVDRDGTIWCFTMEENIQWEPCDIRHCTDVIPIDRCYDTDNHHGYTGKWSHTITGIECQRWDAQTPHIHNDTDTMAFPDDTLVDAGNFCRDPDNTGFLWCYTTDSVYRRQPCGIAKCHEHIPCRPSFSTRHYTGSVARTYSGKTCQSWSSQVPHRHQYNINSFEEVYMSSVQNYCRDPNDSGMLWCYTTDPETEWEPCDIALCPEVTGNCKLYGISPNPANPPSIRDGFTYYQRLT